MIEKKEIANKNFKKFKLKSKLSKIEILESQKILPFLPTPIELVDLIFQKLKPPPNSLIFDLGSGDGRIILKAISDYNLFGIGIEINDQLYNKSINSLKKLPKSIRKRGKFIKGDIFELNLEIADIVFVYATPSSLKYLKHVLKTCKNGCFLVVIKYYIDEEYFRELNFKLIESIEINSDSLNIKILEKSQKSEFTHFNVKIYKKQKYLQ